MKNGFFCKECDFKTQKQSSYTRHLETNKHKQKCNKMCIEDNVSEISTHSGSNSNSNDTIEKDKYIELLKEQINNLKEQLKDKDEIIKMLKNNQNNQNNQSITQNKNNNEDDDNSSCKSNKDIKLSTEALTIEEYYDNIKNGINNPFLIQEIIRIKPENKNGYYDEEEGIEYNEWGEVVEPVNENILILKSVDVEDYSNDEIKLYTKLVIDGLKSLNKNKRPIVCSNKTLKRFWVNTREKGWVKMEEEDINKVFYKLIGFYYNNLGKALVNTGRFGENNSLKFNQQYNITYELYKASNNKRKATQTLSNIFFRVDKEDYEIITKHIRSKLLDKDM